GGIWIRGYTNDLVALHVQIKLATDAAIGASGSHNFVGTSQPVRHSVVERSSRTDRRTRTARFASRFEHRRVIAGDKASIVATKAYSPNESALDFGARPHTTRAHDAFVEVDAHERIRIAVGWESRCWRRVRHGYAVMAGPMDKLRVSCGVGGAAGFGVAPEQ